MATNCTSRVIVRGYRALVVNVLPHIYPPINVTGGLSVAERTVTFLAHSYFWACDLKLWKLVIHM